MSSEFALMPIKNYSATIAIVSILALAQLVFSEKVQTITICGCPGVATAVQECEIFEIGRCSPVYRLFDEYEGVFAYIIPVLNDDEETITLKRYVDEDCTTPAKDFQSTIEYGWVGKCYDECWSETESKWGQRNVTFIEMCGCPGVATAVQECVFLEECKCTPHYKEFDKSKGVFADITPVFSDPDQKGHTIVTLYPYADKDCTVLNFQPSGNNGWEGKCRNECWSETISKWGAKECYSLSSAYYQSALRFRFLSFFSQ